MGTGRFKNGKFDLTAVANFLMTDADLIEWVRCFNKVSELFYNCSEGQVSLGNVFICDESIGLDIADFILYAAGDPSYSSGSLGSLGSGIHLMPYVKRLILTVVHEMGHHAWGLGDEYCGPYEYETLDRTSPSPDKKTIPIVDSGRADNELADSHADALLMFGGSFERRAISADTSTTITVDADFSELPTDAPEDWVLIQIPAECSDVADSNYCIMETSRGSAGYFDGAGNWIDVAHPVTEFCTNSNHDPDNDTAQEDRNGESCWETIVSNPEFSTLVAPDPASGVLPAGHVNPNVFALDKKPRFALVLDRSGSMATGNKMSDTKHGAIYWLEFCALETDLLTIISYDHIIDQVLTLTEVGTLPDINTQIGEINLLTPRGTTNIRDGLFEALNQIQTPATRAAVQVALLLTDGKHNTPAGSEASEVLPSFNEAGVRIYTLGVGEPDAVDMDVLDELAEETGGTPYAVGDDEPGIIEAAMIEINAEVRGGIITTNPGLFPDSKKMELDGIITKITSNSQKKRPPFEKICKILGLKDLKDVLHSNKKMKGIFTAIPVKVEKQCRRVSFNLVFPKSSKLWLYLVDPKGHFVDMNTIKHVISSAPHDFAVINNPDPGCWYMIALRASTGPAFKFKAIAGGENRAIQVFGGASRSNCKTAPVRVYASARYNGDLSGLHVTASVVSPSGIEKQIKLDDNNMEEPHSGEYEGFFKVNESGRYHGTIYIENIGKAIMAKPARRLLDSDKKKLDVRVKAPKFVRVIPFYFDSGKRPEVRDMEKDNGITKKYGYIKKRLTKLKSAKLVRKK